MEQYRSAQRRRVAQGSTERRLEEQIVKNTRSPETTTAGMTTTSTYNVTTILHSALLTSRTLMRRWKNALLWIMHTLLITQGTSLRVIPAQAQAMSAGHTCASLGSTTTAFIDSGCSTTTSATGLRGGKAEAATDDVNAACISLNHPYHKPIDSIDDLHYLWWPP